MPQEVTTAVPQLISESIRVERFTAHVAVDQRADFLVAISHASPAEIASRTIRVENTLMSQEELLSKGVGALRARLDGETGIAKRSADNVAMKAQSAIGNSRNARSALSKSFEKISGWRTSQSHHANSMHELARVAVAAALPRLRIAITPAGCMCLRLLPSNDFAISWSEGEVHKGPRQLANNIKFEQRGAWTLWDRKNCTQFIAQHAVAIPVCT
jgi:hypothetical protein